MDHQIFSHVGGEIMRSILTYDATKKCLELQPTERSYLGFLTHSAQVRYWLLKTNLARLPAAIKTDQSQQ